jgi:hypothetical protein
MVATRIGVRNEDREGTTRFMLMSVRARTARTSPSRPSISSRLKAPCRDNVGNDWDPGNVNGWCVGGTRVVHGGSWEAGIWLTSVNGACVAAP